MTLPCLADSVDNDIYFLNVQQETCDKLIKATTHCKLDTIHYHQPANCAAVEIIHPISSHCATYVIMAPGILLRGSPE